MPGDGHERVVAIVGAGAAGILTAIHILHAAPPGTHLLLIDPAPADAAGPAYGSPRREHVLNVRAAKMSARPGDSNAFVQWLDDHGHAASGDAFVPRHHFAAHLHDELAAAVRSSHARFERVHGRVVDACRGIHRDERVHLTLDHGGGIDADHVVLALGNGPIAPLGDRGLRIVDDVWGTPWLAAVRPDDEVLVVGTGLTAVDMALSLDAQGHRGRVTLVSRHGHLPAIHLDHDRAPRALPPQLLDASTATELLRGVRLMLDAAACDGEPWHTVIDALRPVTVRLWQSLGDGERARLLRHLRPTWERHRHRMSPMAAAVLHDMASGGRVQVVAGRVIGVESRCEGAAAWIREPHAARPVRARAQWIVNATGPRHELRARRDPLLESLVRRGAARSGPLELGLDVSRDGAVRDATGVASPTVFAVGALRVGCEWESTAIPEIRAQAAAIASRVTAETPRMARAAG